MHFLGCEERENMREDIKHKWQDPSIMSRWNININPKEECDVRWEFFSELLASSPATRNALCKSFASELFMLTMRLSSPLVSPLSTINNRSARFASWDDRKRCAGIWAKPGNRVQRERKEIALVWLQFCSSLDALKIAPKKSERATMKAEFESTSAGLEFSMSPSSDHFIVTFNGTTCFSSLNFSSSSLLRGLKQTQKNNKKPHECRCYQSSPRLDSASVLWATQLIKKFVSASLIKVTLGNKFAVPRLISRTEPAHFHNNPSESMYLS